MILLDNILLSKNSLYDILDMLLMKMNSIEDLMGFTHPEAIKENCSTWIALPREWAR